MKRHDWRGEPTTDVHGHRMVFRCECGALSDPVMERTTDKDGNPTSTEFCTNLIPLPTLREPNARVDLIAAINRAVEIRPGQVPPELAMDVAFQARQREERRNLERVKSFVLTLLELRAEEAEPIPYHPHDELLATNAMHASSVALCDAMAWMFVAIEAAKDGTGRKVKILDPVMGQLVEGILAFGAYLAMAEDSEKATHPAERVQAALFHMEGDLTEAAQDLANHRERDLEQATLAPLPPPAPECRCIERREGTVRYADQSNCPVHVVPPDDDNPTAFPPKPRPKTL